MKSIRNIIIVLIIFIISYGYFFHKNINKIKEICDLAQNMTEQNLEHLVEAENLQLSDNLPNKPNVRMLRGSSSISGAACLITTEKKIVVKVEYLPADGESTY